MISHGNIVSNFNKSVHRSDLGPDGVFIDVLNTYCRLEVHNSMKYPSTSLRSQCVSLLAPLHVISTHFFTPVTFVIIANPNVEATLETIARFVFRQSWYNNSIYFNQVSSHNCLLPAILHTTNSTSHPNQGRGLKLSKI